MPRRLVCITLVVIGAATAAAAAVAIARHRAITPCAPAAAPSRLTSRDWRAEVTRLVAPILDAELAPGAVVGLYDAGSIEIIGLGRLSEDDPRTPDDQTLFEIGSVSKVFTCLLLADAVTRGDLTLDQPVAGLLPPGTKAPSLQGRAITLAHLATHTSALPRDVGPAGTDRDASSRHKTFDVSRDELYAFVSSARLSQAPGATFAYSNLGMGLLGQLLADRAGVSYESLLRERIAARLDLPDTTTTPTPAQERRLAPPSCEGERVAPLQFGALAGCGGIRSTARDLMALVAAHARPGSTPLEGAVRLAITKRPGVLGEGSASMGLGWSYAADGMTLWHGGQTAGSSAAIFVNPTLDKGVIILANGYATAVVQTGERLFQSLCGMPVEPLDVRRAVVLAQSDRDRVLGTYRSAVGFEISVTGRGGGVWARLTGQEALRVHPTSPSRYFYRVVDAELEFELDGGTAPAAAVTLHQNGMHLRCPRTQ